MKNFLLTVISVFFISSFTYATNFSLGITAGGWGPTFVRGSDWEANLNGINKQASIKYSMAFAPVAQVIGQVDFIPYFGIEFGVGYSIKSIGVSITDSKGKDVFGTIKYAFKQLSIPLRLKGQYELADSVNIYLAVGPKFNLNIVAPTQTSYTNDK